MDRTSSSATYTRTKTINEYASIEDISKEKDVLVQDNFLLTETSEVMERYLRKRSPAMLTGMERFIEVSPPIAMMRVSMMDKTESIGSTKSSPSPMTTVIRGSNTSSITHGITSRSNAQSFASCKISHVVMGDMVERELEEGRMILDKLQRKFESTKFLLQTEEENLRVDIHNLETSQTTLDNFLIQNTGRQSGKVDHDKFFRFLEHELETGDRILRKMKLKTKSMQNEYKRILAQQQQKLELRERLHPIDIEKLLIENEEQLEILELKNNTLKDLRKTVGKKGQNLVSVKSKLNDTIHSLNNLKHDAEQKVTKCKFMEEQKVQNECLLRTAEFNYQNIMNLFMKYKCPDIHTYLQIQSNLEEMKSEKDIWKRRCMYQYQCLSLLEHQILQLSSIPRSPRNTQAHSPSMKRQTQ